MLQHPILTKVYTSSPLQFSPTEVRACATWQASSQNDFKHRILTRSSRAMASRRAAQRGLRGYVIRRHFAAVILICILEIIQSLSSRMLDTHTLGFIQRLPAGMHSIDLASGSAHLAIGLVGAASTHVSTTGLAKHRRRQLGNVKILSL
jgi:hypothetical protein